MDSVDLQILSILQANGRASNAEIARTVGLAPSAVLERIRKLERRGRILGYTARLAPAEVGQGLLAFISVVAEEGPRDTTTAERLAALPEVQEIHHVAGEDCFLLKVRCASTEALGHLLRERIGGIEAVRRTRTTIVLETVKETSAVPLDGLEAEPAS